MSGRSRCRSRSAAGIPPRLTDCNIATRNPPETSYAAASWSALARPADGPPARDRPTGPLRTGSRSGSARPCSGRTRDGAAGAAP